MPAVADTAAEVRELAEAWVEDDPKLYRFLRNYAALLEAQPELLRRLRAAEADAERLETALRDLLDFARRRIHSSLVPPQAQRAIDLLSDIDAAREKP